MCLTQRQRMPMTNLLHATNHSVPAATGSCTACMLQNDNKVRSRTSNSLVSYCRDWLSYVTFWVLVSNKLGRQDVSMGPASSPDMTRSTKRRALNSDGLFHSQETGQRPCSHGRRRSRWYGQDGCRRRSQRHSHGRIRTTQRILGCGSSKLRHSHGRRRSNWTRDRFLTCNACEKSWTSSSIVTDCLGSAGRTINRMSKNKHMSNYMAEISALWNTLG